MTSPGTPPFQINGGIWGGKTHFWLQRILVGKKGLVSSCCPFPAPGRSCKQQGLIPAVPTRTSSQADYSLLISSKGKKGEITQSWKGLWLLNHAGIQGKQHVDKLCSTTAALQLFQTIAFDMDYFMDQIPLGPALVQGSRRSSRVFLWKSGGSESPPASPLLGFSKNKEFSDSKLTTSQTTAHPKIPMAASIEKSFSIPAIPQAASPYVFHINQCLSPINQDLIPIYPPHILTPPGRCQSNFHPKWIKESFPSLFPVASKFFWSQQAPDDFSGVSAQFPGGSVLWFCQESVTRMKFSWGICKCHTEQIILEWVGLERTFKIMEFHPSATDRDTFHYPKWLQALSNLALDTSKNAQKASPWKGLKHRTWSVKWTQNQGAKKALKVKHAWGDRESYWNNITLQQTNYCHPKIRISIVSLPRALYFNDAEWL